MNDFPYRTPAAAMELKAAIKLDDLMHATAARPNRHHDVIRVLRDNGWTGPVQGDRQGFDHKGTFISRAEAAKRVGKEGILFTEDLW
ncbi:MAG: hypothetical protein KAY22_05640 [Rhizorhabdus sp.]|uniref:hypothetical protein n=1 Tax=Rhizorhabdus sp. TaxID=1968843 RepID=UPI001B651C0D|nr:hypothetical protein [Rhizorhabdus sp.]MBP8231768.1 hypothetical protein [Rhizorhabdus sp.]